MIRCVLLNLVDVGFVVFGFVLSMKFHRSSFVRMFRVFFAFSSVCWRSSFQIIQAIFLAIRWMEAFPVSLQPFKRCNRLHLTRFSIFPLAFLFEFVARLFSFDLSSDFHLCLRMFVCSSYFQLSSIVWTIKRSFGSQFQCDAQSDLHVSDMLARSSHVLSFIRTFALALLLFFVRRHSVIGAIAVALT